MNDVKDVFEKTNDLAHALLGSDIYKAMKAAEETAMADREATEAMGRYIEHKSALEELLGQDAPDSLEMNAHSEEMERIQESMQSIPSIVAMTEARQEFSNLIGQVNQIISFVITGEMGGECGGSCDSCGGGCGHVH